ncbi:hypothetical protein F4809DRAFT_473535 [Biscogniauxia mediterranea]|nr:hypothetical protein F4809DRAFT_473535 [Biscogniauxia mediterranea]
MLANVVLAAALVSAASAHLPAVAKREFLQNRQDQDLDETCVSAVTAVMPLYDSLPTPPDDLLSVTMPADPCATPTFTGSLASEYSSYTSEVMDWYSSNSAALNDAISSCTNLASYQTAVPSCSSDAAATTDAGNTTAAPGSSSAGPSSTSGFATATTTSGSSASTGTNGSSSSSSTVTPTANAAPRETGYVMVAAAAAAGLMGVVAAL